MKKMSLLSLLVIFTLFVPPVFAQEGMLEPVSLPQIQNSVPAQFNVIVTGSGKLIVKPGEVFTEGEEEAGTVLPYLVSDPQSIPYPSQAMSQGWEGKMVIAVEILTDGSVGLYQVMQSTGHEVLDEAATQAIKGWKFHPAMTKDSQPIKTCIQVPITFQLQDE